MPRGPKIDKNIERLIIQVHEANPNLTAKEVQVGLWETKEWKMIPAKNFPENWPGVDAIQKLIKEARDRKIRTGPDIKDRPWSLVSLSKYPVPSEALPFILKVWARSMEKNDPLTINQALWISRIYTLFKAKTLGDLEDTSKAGEVKPPFSLKEYQRQSKLNHLLISMPTDLKVIDLLWAIVKTLALNEKVFRNDYPNDDYPRNRDDILYYWMCDAELYGILPEGEPSARDLITRFHEEFSSKFIPEQKSKSEREAIIKRLMKKIDEGGIQ
jgi:hypothetical protein